MVTFLFVDGWIAVNVEKIECIEPRRCAFSTEDSDVEEGDVIGSRIILPNNVVETTYTPTELITKIATKK